MKIKPGDRVLVMIAGKETEYQVGFSWKETGGVKKLGLFIQLKADSNTTTNYNEGDEPMCFEAAPFDPTQPTQIYFDKGAASMMAGAKGRVSAREFLSALGLEPFPGSTQPPQHLCPYCWMVIKPDEAATYCPKRGLAHLHCWENHQPIGERPAEHNAKHIKFMAKLFEGQSCGVKPNMRLRFAAQLLTPKEGVRHTLADWFIELASILEEDEESAHDN